jgi:plastocyanin
MRPVLVSAWIIAMLAGAGCAAGSSAGSERSAASVQRAGAQADVVAMEKSYRFEPVVIEVPAGTTVTWINDDNFTHNVQFSGGMDWTSPSLKPGESATLRFNESGTYAYQCVFHSQNMRGQVVVLPR